MENKRYLDTIVSDETTDAILERLWKAKEEVFECYSELSNVSVLRILRKETNLEATVEVNEEKLNNILERMQQAREEILNNYSELKKLGVTSVVDKKTATENQ